MIIECPACSTQYDIKVELPPEGRTVRCAKCENVWRATPGMEDGYPADEAYEAGGDGMDATGYDADAEEAGGWGPEVEEEEEAQAQAFSHGYYPGAGSRQEEAPDAGHAGFAGSRTASTGGYPVEEEAASHEETGGDARWFASFARRNQTPAPAAQEEFDDPGLAAAAAGPAPFPRTNPAMAAADRGVRTLDDARAAVRDVFASLGEQRAFAHASGIQAPVTAYADTEQEAYPFRSPAETGGAGASGWDASPEEEQGLEPAGGMEGFAGGGWSGAGTGEENAAEAQQGWLQDWQARQREQEQEAAPSGADLDAQLRAALQAHFPSHTAPVEEAEAPDEEAQFQQEEPAAAAGDGEEGLPEASTEFWQQPLPPRTAQPAGEAFPLGEEGGEPPASETVFDERLFRELEESRDLAQHLEPKTRQPGGALALAAAWGLFLSVACGFTAGLFGFREIAAGAVPGLAAFYRTIGMPVMVQPLIFEGIQYEWAVSDFKPVLHIKGAVYNRAQRAVGVPDLVVSIKDDDPAHDKEYPASLSVENGKIQPDERAEFDIELASPSSSVGTVELELRNVR